MPNQKWDNNNNNNNIILIINIWTCMHSQVPWHTFPASLLSFNLPKMGKLDKDSYYSRKPKPSKLKWHVCGDREVMAELWVKAVTTFLFDYYRKAVICSSWFVSPTKWIMQCVAWRHSRILSSHKESNHVTMWVEPLVNRETSQTQKENYHMFRISMCACVTFNFKMIP